MKASPQRIEQHLASLIAVPSVTGDEYAAQDLVAAMLEEAGASVERLVVPLTEIETDPDFPGVEVPHTDLPIVAGRLRGLAPGPTRMVSGHVDVVPPGDPTSWTTPPFQPDVRDGAMYGRGACDMKGGLVAAIEALRLVAEAREFAGEIVVLAVPAEEDGGSGTFAAIKAGYSADACVIPEPTDLGLVVAHAGAITFTLDVPGRAAHASMRREGVSALDNLSYLVDALKADEAVRNASATTPEMVEIGLPYPTIIGQVEGGNWASTVMDRVVAHGRYGVTLEQDCDGAADDLRAAIERAAAEHEFLADNPVGVTVWGARFDSAALGGDHPLPASLEAAAARAGARVPARIGLPAGADMRLFINHADTPTVMYGPGDIRRAHSADEHVALADVVECAEVLAEWLVGSG
ncbi:MAG: ArgE/DapE family deacylase [Acidimicrobiia bacterium]|nr:ArgE/DapE family deacylase [Acidimicrobiia bacterium]NNF09225.1 ArgE/DapE family deacylase [Acidimicrobiia bacterium]NNL71129.1 ArgE/DapE family deacylase [Acidimicrobiia bacterium]